ncbi:HigA family addiction module antitoxin [Polaromonas sp. P1-6]|nr:HigA family addiction module antitoxin [Polaromonas sp. P1-6]
MFKNGMRPIHPGEVLREDFLKPLGMTAHALSKALHVTPARINDIVNEKRGVTPETALRLARYFGGDPVSWLNLQLAYDLKLAEKAKAKAIEKEIVARKNDERFALAA